MVVQYSFNWTGAEQYIKPTFPLGLIILRL